MSVVCRQLSSVFIDLVMNSPSHQHSAQNFRDFPVLPRP
jgi:hypothetical protein